MCLEKSLILNIVSLAYFIDAMLRESGRRVHYLKADLTKVEEAKALGQKALELYPSGIDILINNAGKLCRDACTTCM